MARNVKVRNAKPPTKTPINAIAVIGFLSNGNKGLMAPKKTLNRAPARKTGYLAIVFQKLCISLNDVKGIPMLFDFRAGRGVPLQKLFLLEKSNL